MKTRLLYLFTRTPLHIGAGGPLGAIDQPILRERHTHFPVIPGAALKGVLADAWTDPVSGERSAEGVWLFGAAGTRESGAVPGVLRFSAANLLAFPVRSARGNFAWITSPLCLRRYSRDGGLATALLPAAEPRDDQALFLTGGPLTLGDRVSGYQVVLEEYALKHAGELPGASAPALSPGGAAPPEGSSVRNLGDHFKSLLSQDAVGREIGQRLVVVSDGMMQFFSQTACEIAEHVAVEEGSGVAGDFFNQENVPSETLFYACVSSLDEQPGHKPKDQSRSADQVLADKLSAKKQVLQIGGDVSTGLGLCTVEMKEASR